MPLNSSHVVVAHCLKQFYNLKDLHVTVEIKTTEIH